MSLLHKTLALLSLGPHWTWFCLMLIAHLRWFIEEDDAVPIPRFQDRRETRKGPPQSGCCVCFWRRDYLSTNSNIRAILLGLMGDNRAIGRPRYPGTTLVSCSFLAQTTSPHC
jgi:hypothetical protein